MKRARQGLIIVAGITILGTVAIRSEVFRSSENDFVQMLNAGLVGNVMVVESSSQVDEDKIRINAGDKIVYGDNRFLNNIGQVYGGPVFQVYYDNELIGLAYHDNTNDWYTNKFYFRFFRVSDKIRFQFKTDGRDKKGEMGYQWITRQDAYTYHESFDPHGKLINTWKE